MRNIDNIIIHCAATPTGREVSAKDIDRWHRARGWRGIGYHYVVRLDGTVEEGRPVEQVGAHVYGHNTTSIGICLIGGASADDLSVAVADYTDAQWTALAALVTDLKASYQGAEVVGHNDFTDAKTCPNFNVREWWRKVRDSGGEDRCPNCGYSLS